MQIRREQSVNVDFDIQDNGSKAQVFANGVPILEFTGDGYLRRLNTNGANLGLRKLPNGRVAIKPKKRH